MRKLTSSNSLNENEINGRCAIAFALSLISGRWKPTILFHLLSQTLRYNELRALIPQVSERVLSNQLRQLENSRLIERTVYPGVPPKSEYLLTELGRSLRPVLQNIESWAEINRHHFQPDEGTKDE